MLETITITRPVAVKLRVTEKYKKKFAADIQAAVQKLDLQLQHLEYRGKRVDLEIQKQNTEQLQAARRQIENERLRCLDTRQKLLEKLKEIAELPPGVEIDYGKVESIVEVQVGDDWQQLMHKEIVLEDDKVIAIRTAL